MTQKYIGEIIDTLNSRYNIKFEREKPFRLLIGVMLSHRTTDKISWPATNRLFKVANTPEKMSKMNWRQIGKLIYPVNYWPTKAKRIVKVCKALLKDFGGKVPGTREELMTLPGVGGKSADIILSFGFGKPVIAIDSHVQWISYVLGVSEKRNESPEKVREKLHDLISGDDRLIVNNVFVEFGREICNTGRPKCYVCPVYKYCKYEKKAYFKNIKRR